MAFVIAISVHEWSHAYVAYRLGDDTAKDMGRLTLNPLAHLDLFGTLALFLIGFGWANPVPYNPHNLRGRFDEVKIALAGPLSNIVLAFIFSLPYRFLTFTGQSQVGQGWFRGLEIMATVNILLAAFNVLPLPPLDGSKIVMIWLSASQRLQFLFYGQWVLLGVILFQVVIGYNLLWLILQPIVAVISILTRGVAVSPLAI